MAVEAQFCSWCSATCTSTLTSVMPRGHDTAGGAPPVNCSAASATFSPVQFPAAQAAVSSRSTPKLVPSEAGLRTNGCSSPSLQQDGGGGGHHLIRGGKR
eukprot:scaffold7037_cov84-Isochrysis_galbana.AAC.1